MGCKILDFAEGLKIERDEGMVFFLFFVFYGDGVGRVVSCGDGGSS